MSVDELLFALFYALTGIATAVYCPKLALRGPWSFVQVAVVPLAAPGFLAYIISMPRETHQPDTEPAAASGDSKTP